MIHAIFTTLVKQNSAQCVSEGKSFPGGKLLIIYKTANMAWRKRILGHKSNILKKIASIFIRKKSLYSSTTSYCPNSLHPSHSVGKSPPVISAFVSTILCSFVKGTSGSQAHPWEYRGSSAAVLILPSKRTRTQEWDFCAWAVSYSLCFQTCFYLVGWLSWVHNSALYNISGRIS